MNLPEEVFAIPSIQWSLDLFTTLFAYYFFLIRKEGVPQEYIIVFLIHLRSLYNLYKIQV